MSIEERLNDISEIKTMMEKSTKFLSLSGLAGIFAGIFALIGASLVYFKYQTVYNIRYGITPSSTYLDYKIENAQEFVQYSFLVGLAVLILALFFGFFFTYRKAKKKGQVLINKTSKRLFINLFIPLGVGGIFAFILLYHHIYYLVAPVTLIFYGLALVNASHFTIRDIKYLGMFEILLGLISSLFIGYTLIFWSIGFGILHILYGIIMYLKYDR